MNRLSLIPEELIRIKADKIWKKRLRDGRDGTPESDWQEAKQYLATHPREVLLWRLNRPFIWLEKSIIEPLDFWADRANIFSFFSKISPILEAVGVLLIPVAIFYFESNREERQIQFEQNIISAQTQVRHQEAVRDYLSQITTIYLETEQGKELQNNEELKILLEVTTIALFDELSVSEDSLLKKDTNIEETIKRDRKGQVIRFLSRLDWINGVEGKEPLLSLQGADLVGADLVGADLVGADLVGADLVGADLGDADLVGADLVGADLGDADLGGADLSGADLGGADLGGADLVGADLVGAYLGGAYLRGADLVGAYLDGAYLRGADLVGADLDGAYLRGADLSGADLDDAYLGDADLRDAYLGDADLRDAYLGDADLGDANLRDADLGDANLRDAYLIDTKNLTWTQIKSACFWEEAIYKGKWNQEARKWVTSKTDNTNFIEELKKDTASNPKEKIDCSQWE